MGEQFLAQGVTSLHVVRMRDIGQEPATQLASAVPEHLLTGRIRIEEQALAIEECHADGRILKDRSVPRLVLVIRCASALRGNPSLLRLHHASPTQLKGRIRILGWLAGGRKPAQK